MENIELRLPAEPQSVRVARQALQPLASQVGSDRAHELVLLVSEVVTNAVRHADHNRSELLVQVSARAGVVHVEVHDTGNGFRAPAVPQPAGDRGSGWGLTLVDQLSQRWGVAPSPTGSCTWFDLII